MLVISIVFSACKKDDAITEKEIDPTEQKILNFKAKMESGSKSGETMSIDSAVWYIEAALNYTYCYVPEEIPEVDMFKIDTFDVNTEAVNEQISFNDIVDAYSQIEEFALLTFEEFNGMNKFLSAVDVEFENNIFTSIIMIEYKFQQNKGLVTGWIWGLKYGSCDGQYLWEKDASTEIYRYTRNTYAQLERMPGYWTDIINIYFDAYNASATVWQDQGPWYSTQQSPVGNNIIIYTEVRDDNTWDRCLTIGDSYDWYKDRAWTAIQSAKDYQDDEYEQLGWPLEMKSYFFTSRTFNFPPPWDEDTHQTHRVEFKYGVYHGGAHIH